MREGEPGFCGAGVKQETRMEPTTLPRTVTVTGRDPKASATSPTSREVQLNG